MIFDLRWWDVLHSGKHSDCGGYYATTAHRKPGERAGMVHRHSDTGFRYRTFDVPQYSVMSDVLLCKALAAVSSFVRDETSTT